MGLNGEHLKNGKPTSKTFVPENRLSSGLLGEPFNNTFMPSRLNFLNDIVQEFHGPIDLRFHPEGYWTEGSMGRWNHPGKTSFIKSALQKYMGCWNYMENKWIINTTLESNGELKLSWRRIMETSQKMNLFPKSPHKNIEEQHKHSCNFKTTSGSLDCLGFELKSSVCNWESVVAPLNRWRPTSSLETRLDKQVLGYKAGAPTGFLWWADTYSTSFLWYASSTYYNIAVDILFWKAMVFFVYKL